MSNVEVVRVRNLDANSSVTLDASTISGATSIGSYYSNYDVAISGLKGSMPSLFMNQTGDSDLTLTSVNSGLTSGTADTINLTLTAVGSSTSAGSLVSVGNGFEKFNITTSGSASYLGTFTAGTPTSGTQSITIAGDQNLELGKTAALANTVSAINASSMTGSLDVYATTAYTGIAITGGSGNDVIRVGSGLDSADTIVGGSGNDTLSINSSLSSAMSKVSGIEVLRMGGSSQTYDVTKITGLTGYELSGATSPIVNNLPTNATLTVLDDVTTGATLALATINGTLNLNIDNTVGATNNGVDVANTTLTNVQTLNISSKGGNTALTDNTAANANSFDMGTTSALTKIVVTGDTNLSLDADGVIDATIGAINSTVTTVDAGSFTGRLFVTASSTASTIMGGTSSDSITGGSSADSLSGGAGNDTITGGGGNDIILGGDGADTLTLGAAGSSGVATVDGGAGDDIIALTSATGAYSLVGGDGNDRFTITASGTLLIASDDTLVGGAGEDSLNLVAVNAASVSFVTSNTVLNNVSQMEQLRIDVSGLTSGGNTYGVTVNDLLATTLGGNLNISVAGTGMSSAAILTIDATSVLNSSTSVTLDASSTSMKYAYLGGNAKDVITLAGNDDTVTFSTAAYLSSNDTINAGSGSDKLAFTDTNGATLSTQIANLSGFETIDFDTAGTAAGSQGDYSITLTDAFVSSNHDGSNVLTIQRGSQSTTPDTATIKVLGGAVTANYALALYGASGADTLVGGLGADSFYGGGGNDSLTGGAGNDVFVANLTGSNNGIDYISDFNFGTSTTTIDKIDLSGLLDDASMATTTFSSSTVSTTLAIGNDVTVINTQTYATVSDVDAAYETLSTTTGSGATDQIVVWQDSLGSVHVSAVDGDGNTADANTDYTVTDVFILQGVTITGIASQINTGDFAVA